MYHTLSEWRGVEISIVYLKAEAASEGVSRFPVCHVTANFLLGLVNIDQQTEQLKGNYCYS